MTPRKNLIILCCILTAATYLLSPKFSFKSPTAKIGVSSIGLSVKTPTDRQAERLTRLLGVNLTDFNTVCRAADRNGCYGDDFYLLLAIWRSEKGGPGFEFGIRKKGCNNLDCQAGEAAFKIMKYRKLSTISTGNPQEDFITFLAQSYCPEDKINWVKNVKFWYNKIKTEIEK